MLPYSNEGNSLVFCLTSVLEEVDTVVETSEASTSSVQAEGTPEVMKKKRGRPKKVCSHMGEQTENKTGSKMSPGLVVC